MPTENFQGEGPLRETDTEPSQFPGDRGNGYPFGLSAGGDMSMGKQRRTQEEMDTLRAAILAVAQADRPVSVSPNPPKEGVGLAS